MNKTIIRATLIAHGFCGVMTTKGLAGILSVSIRTINGAKNKGQLKQIDRNTFDLESAVEWLFAHPRYLTKISMEER